jgi:hypothetical protein
MRILRAALLAAIGLCPFNLCSTATTLADESKLVADNAATPSTSNTQAIETSFQQGVHGYSGTVDTEIWALARKTILDQNPNASSDANNDGGESQVVMRFDNIFGENERQIPLGSTIVSAKLVVAAFDQGSTVNLHRMLVPFGKHSTWDSLISGVSADGFEASRHKDGFTFGKIAASTSGAIFDVTDTVQIWSLGKPNHGWVFLNTGGNGWDFYTAEFDKIEQRPKLVVKYIPPTKLKTAALVAEQAAATGNSSGQ